MPGKAVDENVARDPGVSHGGYYIGACVKLSYNDMGSDGSRENSLYIETKLA